MSNVPIGTENNPLAPWNQDKPKELEFEVTINQSLSKTCKVTTSDYTEETDWSQVYNSQHYSPITLIGILKCCLKSAIEHRSIPFTLSIKKHIIKECENWVEGETEVIGE
nr:MAG TPA: hypothetical protein [Caudoviricetes sp.]